MASRIQGITVEIGGDTTKLSKALESVNKSIKGTQSGLKDVNKLLKLDPSNTELVVQKQKMLKDAIEATKEKLATLKTAAQQANEQLANGEITQQQYDALQREIVETEQNLRSLQDQAATTNATLAKIDEAGEKLQNIGSSVENVGKKFLPVTAAVTGLGTAAVKTAADFDSEMSKVSAISGATGDDFDQLRAKAREMGAKTKFSASEAASAMEYMAMAGWKTGDMLNGIEGIMNLAAASGEDLATTSDIVTDALTAFGLSAADSGHFADILAAASSNANTNVSMMGETFKYCAPIAGALGFSAEDTAEAIGLMANSGIKASQAGTSLRTIMNNLSGEVTFVGKNIGEVTIATSNADGSMRSLNDILADCRVAFSGLSESEKAANAEALVGKNAMSGFLALMNSSGKDINKLRGAIENCDGASESMAETMQDNLNGQLTILKSQLEELAISFGDILMPTIRKIVSAVQQFVDKLNSMDESTRETIIKIGLLAASIGPLLIVLGKTISTVGTAMRGFSSLAKGVRLLITHVGSASGVFSKLGVVLGGLSGPVVAVVAVIGTLVAAFMNLWNTNEEFRTAITGIKKNVKSVVKAVQGLAGSMSSNLTTPVDSLGDWMDSVVGSFATTIKRSQSGIGSAARDVGSGIQSQLMPGLSGLKTQFQQLWTDLQGITKTAVGGMSDEVKQSFADMKDSIGELSSQTSSLGNAIRSLGDTFNSDFLKSLGNGISKVGDTVNTVTGLVDKLGSMKNTIGNLGNTMQNLGNVLGTENGGGLLSNIGNFLSKIGSADGGQIVSKFGNLISGLTSKMGGLGEGISGIISKLGSLGSSGGGILSNLGGLLSGVVSKIGGLGGSLSGIVSSIGSSLGGIAGTVGTTLSGLLGSVGTTVSGLAAGAGTALAGVASSAGGFLASAGTALAGLAGPAGIAVAAVGGIGLGLTALWKNCDGFREGVTNIWNKVTSVFSNGVNAIKNGISNAASAIGNVASSIWGGIKNVASSAVSWGKDIVGGIAGGIKKGVSWVGNAVKSVAKGIRSFLHFSVPDEGPLSDADTYIHQKINRFLERNKTHEKSTHHWYHRSGRFLSGRVSAGEGL